MEIREVDFKEYFVSVPDPWHVYASGPFNYLNRNKCEKLYYLLFGDGKNQLALTGGINSGTFYSPFSSPFGGFIPLEGEVRIQKMDAAVSVLKTWAVEKGVDAIKITHPPSVYDESFIARQSNALFRSNFVIESIDINHSCKVSGYGIDINQSLRRNARKNLKTAIVNDLNFFKCNTIEEKKKAYDVIKLNRESKGFPLKMSWDLVEETIKVVRSDFFICFDTIGQALASAIVFHVARDIVQVIYWGDDPGFSHLRPMNYLTFQLFRFFDEAGIRIVDTGPSTKDSEPNYGLCEFKESIGCDATQKLTFFCSL